MKVSNWNAAAAGALLSVAVAGAATQDFGTWIEDQLDAFSGYLFGIGKPLAAPAPEIATPYRAASHKASQQIMLAKGLKAEYLTRSAGNAFDQFDFWPDPSNPKYLIGCVEGGRQVIGTLPGGNPKYNPSVQRIDLKTGEVVTVLRGMTSCDPVRVTPWGTLVAGEEATDGGLYEILDPAHALDLTIVDRTTGSIANPDGSPSTMAKKQKGVPVIAWEGIGITPKGVMYIGDELRPGTGTKDKDGGAIFKFVPAAPYAGGGIANLDQSPLAAGKVYALQVSCVGHTQQYGQGCEVGNGAWIEVAAATARGEAHTKGATGYYRPEDGHLDPDYQDSAHAEAVRFCWANTLAEEGFSYGEVMCLEDSEPSIADATKRTVIASRLLEGDTRLNQPDNLEFQPRTGNLYVIEDHPNGEVFACLDDGEDRDLKSDGCVAVASVIDPSAEPTGWMFTGDGRTAYVAIQHSDDDNMPKVDDYGTDDILKITGFKVPHSKKARKRGNRKW